MTFFKAYINFKDLSFFKSLILLLLQIVLSELLVTCSKVLPAAKPVPPSGVSGDKGV